MPQRIAENPNHWSDIVGMPDKVDLKNIRTIINNFKKQKFNIEGFLITGKQFIELEVADARRTHGIDDIGNAHNKENIKSHDIDARAVIAMPIPLDQIIKEAYPTMFRDKAHFFWFVYHFPEFKIANVVKER